jgi:hypothetical protein
MPFVYKVELMPSGSATLTEWLDEQGAENWELVQVVPLSPITQNQGTVLCYFMSGSAE